MMIDLFDPLKRVTGIRLRQVIIDYIAKRILVGIGDQLYLHQ